MGIFSVNIEKTKVNQYDEYIKTHRDNVKKSFDNLNKKSVII